MNKQKKQLLDPFATICRFGQLYFCCEGTKLYINDHIITLQKPLYSQGIARAYYGSNKEDICLLYLAIKKSIEWYITENITISNNKVKLDDTINVDKVNNKLHEANFTNIETTKCDESLDNNEDVREIMNFAYLGLQKLQKTYGDGNVVLALQLYMNYMHDSINNVPLKRTHFPEIFLEKEEYTQNLINHNCIKNIWNKDTVKQIANLFRMANTSLNSGSSYSDDIIEGYLKSIDSLLDVTDKNFQNLIRASYAGTI